MLAEDIEVEVTHEQLRVVIRAGGAAAVDLRRTFWGVTPRPAVTSPRGRRSNPAVPGEKDVEGEGSGAGEAAEPPLMCQGGKTTEPGQVLDCGDAPQLCTSPAGMGSPVGVGSVQGLRPPNCRAVPEPPLGFQAVVPEQCSWTLEDGPSSSSSSGRAASKTLSIFLALPPPNHEEVTYKKGEQCMEIRFIIMENE